MRVRGTLVCSWLAVGCAPTAPFDAPTSAATDTDAGDDGGSGSLSSGPDAGTNGVADDSTSADSGETSPDSGEPSDPCGDGVVAGDEQCDDGNTIDGDGCNADCVPSGIVKWSYAETVYTAVAGVAADADGNAVVVGTTGKWYDVDPTLGLIRAFDPTGQLVVTQDATPRGAAWLSDVLLRPDGTYWATGGVAGGRSWIRAINADSSQDVVGNELPSLGRSDISPAGVVVAAGSTLAVLDDLGGVIWQAEVGPIADVAIDDAGFVWAWTNEVQGAKHIQKFDATGALVATSEPFGRAGSPAITALDGGGLAAVYRPGLLRDPTSTELLVFDADLALQWSVEVDGLAWRAVAEADNGDLVVAGVSNETSPYEYFASVSRYHPGGELAWTNTLDAPPDPWEETMFEAVAIGGDGTIIAGGIGTDYDDPETYLDPRAYVVAFTP